MLTLNNDCLTSVTAVPDLFFEQYMPAANGEFVKVYLYLLKLAKDHAQNSSLSSLADFFSCTENDIVRALKYWEKQGLLSLSYTTGEANPTGIAFLPLAPAPERTILPLPDVTPAAPVLASAVPVERASAGFSSQHDPASVEAAHPSQEPAAVPYKDVSLPASDASAFSSKDQKPALSSADPASSVQPPRDAAKTQADVKNILYLAQTYFRRLLTPTEVERLLYFYDELHFSADLLEYLIEYCVSKGSTSMHYLEKVGLAWHEKGISDLESAKRETTTWNKHYYTILKAFGIRNRAPIPREAEYMDRWLNTYQFSLDLILEACQRTVSQTGQPSFQYAEGILSKWQEQNVHSMKDVTARDAAHKKGRQTAAAPAEKKAQPSPSSANRFNNFAQREYDYTKLEEQLLKSE